MADSHILPGADPADSKLLRKPIPPRVLHIITVLSVGGVEIWLLALLRHINSLGGPGADREQLDILLTGGRKSELDHVAESLGANLYYIPFGRRYSVSFYREFRKLLRERRYVAIHDHQDYASAWHYLSGAGELPSVRIVHVHSAANRLANSTRSPLRHALFPVSRKLVTRFATHVLGTSEQILESYGFKQRETGYPQVRRLRCGFDVSPFAQDRAEANESVCKECKWPPGSDIVLFVGRLDEAGPGGVASDLKNHQFALDVVRTAIAKGSDIRFAMVGGGRSKADLEKQVAEWGLSDRVRLVGQNLDVSRFMAASRCLLFPSRAEGLGMVAVEAQAAGLRVLASDAVPREAIVIPDLVTFLPLAAGAPTWALELHRLIQLPRYDVALANAAVKRSDFSIENSYAALHDVYQRASR